MIKDNISFKDIINSIVPISRFNRGEANKIFDEVKENGVKFVVKNNVPECVLVRPERYEEMLEALEDYVLFFEAEKRRKQAEKTGFINSENVLDNLGISEDDFRDIEADIE